MHIAEVVVLPEYEEKLASKHGVDAEEVIEVFANKPRIRFAEEGRRANEHVYFAPGQSFAGRHIVVFFVYKRSRVALVISVRDMEARAC